MRFWRRIIRCEMCYFMCGKMCEKCGMCGKIKFFVKKVEKIDFRKIRFCNHFVTF